MAADAGMIANQPAVESVKNYVKGLTGKSFWTKASTDTSIQSLHTLGNSPRLTSV